MGSELSSPPLPLGLVIVGLKKGSTGGRKSMSHGSRYLHSNRRGARSYVAGYCGDVMQSYIRGFSVMQSFISGRFWLRVHLFGAGLISVSLRP